MVDRATYKAYKNMIYRCTNPEYTRFKDYGGRGITVCDRWLLGFEYFIQDMGIRPSKDYSIDRINNDLGYYSDNCRWATRAQQMVNKRQTIVYSSDVIDDVILKLKSGMSIKDIGANSPMSLGGIYHYKAKLKNM